MLNHPNIAKLIKLLDDQERGCCYMVIEYVSGGELFDYIVSHGRLREKDARKFIRQVCKQQVISRINHFTTVYTCYTPKHWYTGLTKAWNMTFLDSASRVTLL